jgi:hypothetical protein
MAIWELSVWGLVASSFKLQVQIDGTKAGFTLEEIRAFEQTAKVEYQGRIYQEVPIRHLLASIDVDIGIVKRIEPWAADGYHKRYDWLKSKRFATIPAYKKDGQPLEEGEGPPRAVYPSCHSAEAVKQVNKLVVKLGEWRLTLVSAGSEKEHILSDLKGLPDFEVRLDAGSCQGVLLQELLINANINLERVQSVSVVAFNGLRNRIGSSYNHRRRFDPGLWSKRWSTSREAGHRGLPSGRQGNRSGVCRERVIVTLKEPE